MAPRDWLAPVSSDRPPSTPISRARRAYVPNTLSCSLHIARGVSDACMQRRTLSHRCTGIVRQGVRATEPCNELPLPLPPSILHHRRRLLPLPPSPKKLAESLGAGTKVGASCGGRFSPSRGRGKDGRWYMYIILLYRERLCARAREEDAGKGW